MQTLFESIKRKIIIVNFNPYSAAYFPTHTHTNAKEIENTVYYSIRQAKSSIDCQLWSQWRERADDVLDDTVCFVLSAQTAELGPQPHLLHRTCDRIEYMERTIFGHFIFYILRLFFSTTASEFLLFTKKKNKNRCRQYTPFSLINIAFSLHCAQMLGAKRIIGPFGDDEQQLD